MPKYKLLFLCFIVKLTCGNFSQLWAQGAYYGSEPVLTVQDFNDIALLASYSTLFGGATGVALLPFLQGPVSQNMRYVAGCASLGFLTGVAVGFYNVWQRKGYRDEVEYMGSNPHKNYRFDVAFNHESMLFIVNTKF